MNMSQNITVLCNQIKDRRIKLIVVTGGVCSSIGKGVLVSALGVILKNSGYSVSVAKWDPYLNVDPGTMSPLVHGEVFVTADGVETDLDLGHYERLIGISLQKESSMSSGQIYQEVLDLERQGAFLGKCIQLVPHVVDVAKKRLFEFALKKNTDFVLVEIGGTIGDMESEIFLETARQLKIDLGAHQFMHAHLSYVPCLSWTGEVKTKPTQHSIMALKKSGLAPDFLFLRADKDLDDPSIEKLSLMCGVKKEHIFQVLTAKPVYRTFLALENQHIGEKVQEHFGLSVKSSDLSEWEKIIKNIDDSSRVVNIGLIVKYVGSNDPYISVVEALYSAAYAREHQVNLVIIDAELLSKTKNNKKESIEWQKFEFLDGIIVPGGFDSRGIEGKILAAQWARENNIPYLGLCLGMQIMIIEAARSLLHLSLANSTEFDKTTEFPVVSMINEQKDVVNKGATMRLGSYACRLTEGSRAYDAYKKDIIIERHRHRYEVNNDYKKDLSSVGVIFSGTNEEMDLVEIAELKNHTFMMGVQFHPEFQSSPLRPHPLFTSFMCAAIKNIDK